jgi:hypothetical protein
VTSVAAFAGYRAQAYPYEFAGTLHVATIAGGTPSDPKVAEGWLKSKLADPDDLIREKVAEVMVERGITAEEAAAEVDRLRHLNGFKRDDKGLYIDGRQLKAAIKEAGSIAVAARKLKKSGWGSTNKGIKSFLAEHVFVLEDRLYLGVAEPTGIAQRFIHTFRGTGIQYEEFVQDAVISFTVATDQSLTDEEWAMIWLTGEQNGIGAARSQGYGRYTVTSWEPAAQVKPLRRRAA